VRSTGRLRTAPDAGAVWAPDWTRAAHGGMIGWMDRALLTDAVASVVHGRQEVVAVYLFGSAARGEMGPESDLDLGVVLARPRCDRATWDALTLALSTASTRATGVERVDVVDLEEQGPLFAHQVLIEGVLLVDNDRRSRVDFESSTFTRALDFRPTYEIATHGRPRAMRRWLRSSGLLTRSGR
jgi:uncharacterized protein